MTRIPNHRIEHEITDFVYIDNREHEAVYVAELEADDDGNLELIRCRLWSWGACKQTRDDLVKLLGEREVARQEEMVEVFADFYDRM